MQRSRSHTALNSIVHDSEDDGEDQVAPYGKGTTTDELEANTEYQIIHWYGNKKKTALVNFSPACLLLGAPANAAETVRKYHMTYKFVNNECRLVKGMLQSHGFRESHPFSSYFNVHWSGCHVKPYTYRALTEFQKVNHFPRSYELTRKDRLFKNVQKMQYAKGFRHFDFVPSSFVLPSEMSDFQSTFLREKGYWIVKPVASSRGRGIYLINDPSQICLDDRCLVSRYIENPLLVDDYKFDLRIYVVVTSFDPLRIYMFEEGLARFSTVKYDKKSAHLGNHWMHLTNYSVNKNNSEYVRCEDPEVDDFGNKWSLSAMLRYLRDNGQDTEALMGKIEDVIVKAILSAETPIATGCRMFVPSRWNCFELFGFDILIDENFKPWLLEINLSPSLACDAPMDLKIKSSLIADLLNVTGVVAHDPIVKCGRRGKIIDPKKIRSLSAHPTDGSLTNKVISQARAGLGLTNEEAKLLRETKEEYKRRGGLVRIFPTPESWDLYGNLHEQQSRNNKMIHSRLFPELWRSSSTRPASAATLAPARSTENLVYCKAKPLVIDDMQSRSEINNALLHCFKIAHSLLQIKSTMFGLCQHDRYIIFERKLETVTSFEPSHTNGRNKPVHNKQVQKIHNISYETQLLNRANNDGHERRRNTLSIQDIIERGETMTTIQARQAFSMYLQRVQHRLLQELSAARQNGHANSGDNEKKEEEQLNLIMRFLRRASANLSKPIDLPALSKFSHANERRGILAKKLEEFVKIYSKDTMILIAKEANDYSTDTDSQSDYDMGNISERDFKTFLAVGSENELEELLTAFTKQNNSSIIFLGTKTNDTNGVLLKKDPDHSTQTEREAKSRKSASRVQDRHDNNNSWREVLQSSKSDNVLLHSDKYTRRITTAKVYSSSVAVNQRNRPTSAKVGSEPALSNKFNRPCSAVPSNTRRFHGNNTLHGVASPQNYEASNNTDHTTVVVGDALQRLLIKQSERNYSAPKTTYYVSSVKSSGDAELNKYRSAPSNVRSERLTDANDTFKSFVNFKHSLAKDNNDYVADANSLEHTRGTQTIETCVSRLLNTSNGKELDDVETANDSLEGRREVKLVSRAQYNAHIKSLDRAANHNSDSSEIQPHPPLTKPPPIRKQIRTQRMVKLSGSSTKD